MYLVVEYQKSIEKHKADLKALDKEMEYAESLAPNWKPSGSKDDNKDATATRFIAMNKELRFKVDQLTESMKAVLDRNSNLKS